ncbi:hypothetical protein HNP84_000255 [Thermocatellispora tengchongensis]|uniref:Uncharacterized protein n=1 Tax=Thermocatellispora tengchongensis TaxID=1073253 RepID=A0A840NZY3_9ACTN|nr:hypothetical protein [Thermocatellispora tengchongensis]MBB5130567.1 hypothetical protein [Thermocatellispora tengchongensis]
MPTWDPADLPPRTEEQIRATRETVARVGAALAVIVAREGDKQAVDVVRRWDLSRPGLDEAARSLGIPPVSDEEWEIIKDRRGDAI